jgi:hypothetical protein
MNNELKSKYQALHLLIVMVIFGGLFLHQAISAQQPSSPLLKRLKDDPGLPLMTNNSLEAPVTITEAVSKEISSADFRNLTGVDANSALIFSFPEVKILNTSSKVVTGFSLVLQIKDPGKFYFVRPSQLDLNPNDSHEIKPNQWVFSPKVNVRTEGGIAKKNVPRDLDSPELWVAGRPSDASLFIVEVKFSDGTEWKVKGKN